MKILKNLIRDESAVEWDELSERVGLEAHAVAIHNATAWANEQRSGSSNERPRRRRDKRPPPLLLDSLDAGGSAALPSLGVEGRRRGRCLWRNGYKGWLKEIQYMWKYIYTYVALYDMYFTHML